jgi:hypothetical protein
VVSYSRGITYDWCLQNGNYDLIERHGKSHAHDDTQFYGLKTLSKIQQKTAAFTAVFCDCKSSPTRRNLLKLIRPQVIDVRSIFGF